MQHLYAPWRTEYHQQKVDGCVFCSIREGIGDKYVFYKDDICFFVMNRYPYNPAHFMIIPNKHTANLEDLSEKEITHIALMAQKGVIILKKWGAKGINIGFNLGEAGGAGIPTHIHLQIVPRFKLDANFMTTIGDTRVYSRDFDKIFEEIKEIAKEVL